jgi:hypothetical protein
LPRQRFSRAIGCSLREVSVERADNCLEPSPIQRYWLEDDRTTAPADAHLIRLEPDGAGRPGMSRAMAWRDFPLLSAAP